MTVNALGDLGQGYSLRNRNAALKQDIQRLSLELSTGTVSDVRGQVAGNYSFLTDVDRKIDVMSSFRIATSEATHFTDQVQTALEKFSTLSGELSGTLISVGSNVSGLVTGEITREARNVLDDMVNTLNGSAAGRALFSGNATDVPALIDSDAILANLKAAISGSATPADMIADAQTWFDDPAGFTATSYQGSASPMSPFALSATDQLSLDVTAADPEFVQSLKSAALAALADDPAFALSSQDQQELFLQLGQDAVTGQNDVVGLQARVGFAQSRIDTITSRNAAEVSSLNIARNTLLEADPYKTATELEEVQFQLQSLYSVTVRMSQLSLVNYL